MINTPDVPEGVYSVRFLGGFKDGAVHKMKVSDGKDIHFKEIVNVAPPVTGEEVKSIPIEDTVYELYTISLEAKVLNFKLKGFKL